MSAPVLEVRVRPSHQVLHRAGNEHFACARLRRDACADVYGDPADLVSKHLNLSHVDPDTKFDPEGAKIVEESGSASDRGSRLIEDGEEPIAGGVHLAPAEPLELVSNERVVRTEQSPPFPIAELRGKLGRSDDVREHHRGQEPSLEPPRHGHSFSRSSRGGNRAQPHRGFSAGFGLH